jgi:hypothetical protein
VDGAEIVLHEPQTMRPDIDAAEGELSLLGEQQRKREKIQMQDEKVRRRKTLAKSAFSESGFSQNASSVKS